MKQLKTIQAGRGLAALAVVMFHLSIAMGDPRYGGNRVFGEWTWRGNFGVDFFFVLSGFIMMMIHRKDIGVPQAWKGYAFARFARLWPIYWLYTLVFCLLVAAGFGTVTKLPNSLADWLSVILLVRLTDVTAPLAVAWTLFHEIAFYGLFSILILNRRVGQALFIAWMAIVAVMFSYPPTDDPTPFQTYFAAYNLDFLIGIAACWIMQHGSRRISNVVLSLGIAILAGTLAYEFGIERFESSGLPYGLAFGGIIAGMAAWERRAAGVSIPFAKELGDASYSLYLIHVPIVGVILKILVAFGLVNRMPAPLIYFLTLVGTILASMAAYMIVEKRIQKLFARRRPVPAAHYASATV